MCYQSGHEDEKCRVGLCGPHCSEKSRLEGLCSARSPPPAYVTEPLYGTPLIGRLPTEVQPEPEHNDQWCWCHEDTDCGATVQTFPEETHKQGPPAYVDGDEPGLRDETTQRRPRPDLPHTQKYDMAQKVNWTQVADDPTACCRTPVLHSLQVCDGASGLANGGQEDD